MGDARDVRVYDYPQVP